MTYSPAATGMPDPMVLSSVTTDVAAATVNVAQLASSGTVAANMALFVPVRLSQTRTYTKAWWLNGAAVSGNIDVGIYTRSANLMTRVAVSTAEAQATVSVLQVATTFPTTTLTPGLYYLAISMTSATAAFWRMSFQTNSVCKSTGQLMATSGASPLPTSITAIATTQTGCPIFGLSESAVI